MTGKYGLHCFDGGVLAEGVVACSWAEPASSCFGSFDGLFDYISSLPKNANSAADIVNVISNTWLGKVGGLLAILGVVAAPITSGDTALRSARLIAADFLKIDQKPILKRLMVSIPLFVLCFIVLQIDFDVLWRYFAWSNQTLSVFTLWALTVYLARNHRIYWITLIPALFMTAVCICYILTAPEGLHLPLPYGYAASALVCLIFTALFARFLHRQPKTQPIAK